MASKTTRRFRSRLRTLFGTLGDPDRTIFQSRTGPIPVTRQHASGRAHLASRQHLHLIPDTGKPRPDWPGIGEVINRTDPLTVPDYDQSGKMKRLAASRTLCRTLPRRMRPERKIRQAGRKTAPLSLRTHGLRYMDPVGNHHTNTTSCAGLPMQAGSGEREEKHE